MNANGDSIPVQKSVMPVTWNGEKVLLEAFVDISEQKAFMAEQDAALTEEKRLNRLTVRRELRMMQLKEEVNDLLAAVGMEAKYRLPNDSTNLEALDSEFLSDSDSVEVPS